MNLSNTLQVQRPIISTLLTILIAGLYAFGNFYQFVLVAILKEVGTPTENEPPTWEQQSPVSYSVFSLAFALIFVVCFIRAVLALIKNNKDKAKTVLIVTLLLVCLESLAGILMS